MVSSPFEQSARILGFSMFLLLAIVLVSSLECQGQITVLSRAAAAADKAGDATRSVKFLSRAADKAADATRSVKFLQLSKPLRLSKLGSAVSRHSDGLVVIDAYMQDISSVKFERGALRWFSDPDITAQRNTLKKATQTSNPLRDLINCQYRRQPSFATRADEVFESTALLENRLGVSVSQLESSLLEGLSGHEALPGEMEVKLAVGGEFEVVNRFGLVFNPINATEKLTYVLPIIDFKENTYIQPKEAWSKEDRYLNVLAGFGKTESEEDEGNLPPKMIRDPRLAW